MAACSTCGSTVLFGGKQVGNLRFCSARCAQNGRIFSQATQVPDSEALLFAAKIHGGPCPQCNGSGPVDIHVSHQVWSALLFSSWKSSPRISCRKCGIKAQAGDFTISLLAGWWGIPWGLIITPVQLGRNLFGMIKAPDPARPSARLLEQARLILARRVGSSPVFEAAISRE